MKLRLTYLLLLCMLLVKGYAHADPATKQLHPGHSIVQQDNKISFNSNLHATHEPGYAESNDDDEEDESASVRKKNIGFYSTYNKPLAFYCPSTSFNNRNSCRKYFFYTPSNRYILLRVMRI